MSNKFNSELGLKISRLRDRRGMTREKLGELSGISDRFIYDIENGNKGVSAETLFKLSKSLNVTSDYLLFGTQEENNFSNIIEILKRLNSSQLKSIEEIILQISNMISKTQS